MNNNADYDQLIADLDQQWICRKESVMSVARPVFIKSRHPHTDELYFINGGTPFIQEDGFYAIFVAIPSDDSDDVFQLVCNDKFWDHFGPNMSPSKREGVKCLINSILSKLATKKMVTDSADIFAQEGVSFIY